jgi:parallel beta-helix repeat protein
VPGGEIWLTEAALYKFTIETALGVLIGTYDNIYGNIESVNPINVNFTGFKGQVGSVEDLADNDGSDWIGFQQAGTGAVAISAQDKMRQILSVKDFDAVGDGVTDDTAAIQAAVNAATANQTVYFPQGTYAVGAAGIAVTSKTGVTLLGDGAIIRITAISTLTTNLGVATIRLSGCTRSGVRGLEINGNSIASSAIGFNACTECFVDKVTVYASGVNGQITSSNGGVRNEFTDNIVHSARLPSSRGLWLGNLNASDMETDVFVFGNTVRNNPASGIVVSSNGGRVIGNHSRTNEGSGIVLPGGNGFSAKNLTVSNNYCIDNLFVGIQSDVISYSTPADLTTDIAVSGNVCNFNRSGGIYAGDTERWTITGNTCTNNIFSGIQADNRSFNLTITGNTCNDTRVGGARTQSAGIRITAASENNYGVVICGNTCVNNIQYGVFLTTVGAFTMSNVAVTGNNCYSNSIAGIFVVEATLGAMINFVVTGNVCNLNTTNDLRLSLRDVAIGSNRYTLNQSVDFFDLVVNSTTPSVAGRTFWRANNSSATTITAFNDGVNGQQIVIRAQNGNTTVATSATIVNNGGTNVLLPTDGTISYVRQGGVWREIFRSF